MRKKTLPFLVLAFLAAEISAQTATNTCGFTAGAEYPVGGTCSFNTFNKPNSFSASMNPGGCGSGNNDDAWGWFTAAGSQTTVTFDPGGAADAILHVFSGTCGSLTQVGCANNAGGGGNESVTFASTAGTNYLVRVQRAGSNWSMNGDLCVYTSTPPVNDEPCGAIALPVGTSCTFQTLTNANGTESPVAPPPCGGFIPGASDVWYSFIAPASGMVVLETQAGTMTDSDVAIYEAPSCAGPFTEVACDADSGPGFMSFLTYNRLTPGSTYFLRVWGWGGDEGDFDLCLRSPALSGGDCTYVLELFDSGENGWGSSRVGISINGSPFTYHTTTDRYHQAVLPMNTGDILVVEYDASGPGQDQNRYTIRQLPSGDGIHTGGPFPSAGIVHTETVDCIPPPAPPEDCRGGETICGSQSFVSTGQGLGFDLDLDPGNFGCLSNAEREGLWYFFSPSSGGNVAFTIEPNDPSDDYDFAVWGPLGSPSCPPPSAPVRCSYAAPSGNTGLNYVATDLSEGAGGDKWVADLAVNTGEVYILYVSNWSQSGIAFSLDWDLTNGASLDCTVLPIELVSFDAWPANERVDLHWSTASETDNAYFEVQRSADGATFHPIGTLAGGGTTSSRSDYFMPDEAPLAGINYYRLRQVDHDGTDSYSDVRSVLFRPPGRDVLLHPNPTQGQVTLTFDHPLPPQVLAETFDPTGRPVHRDQVGAGPGQRALDFDLSGLAPGPYLIRLSTMEGRPLATVPFVRR